MTSKKDNARFGESERFQSKSESESDSESKALDSGFRRNDDRQDWRLAPNAGGARPAEKFKNFVRGFGEACR